MKGLVFNIQHFSVHDGPGIRTTVFLKGCPLKCRWCFNPESQEYAPSFSYHADNCRKCFRCINNCPQSALSFENNRVMVDKTKCTWCGKCESECPGRAIRIFGKEMTSEDLIDELLKDKVFYNFSNGGVTFSGGEVLSQSSFVMEVTDRLREKGVHTLIETSGYGSKEDLLKLAAHVDEIYYDVKLLDDQLHEKFTGQSNQVILRNLEALKDRNVPVTVRIPVIWGINDEDNIIRTAEYVSRLGFIKRVGLLPYNDFGVVKYEDLGREYRLNNIIKKEESALQKYIEVFENLGIKIQTGI